MTLEVKKRGGDGTPQKITLTRTATAVVPKKRVVEVEGGGGLFTGASGPKPPPVVYVPEALAGMRVGGRRNIVVPADVGYEDVGEGGDPAGGHLQARGGTPGGSLGGGVSARSESAGRGASGAAASLASLRRAERSFVEKLPSESKRLPRTRPPALVHQHPRGYDV